MSVRISSELKVKKHFARAGTEACIISNSGNGWPRHILASIQEALRANVYGRFSMLKIMFAIGSIALVIRILSLTFVLSPAIFPRHQIACSIISKL
jgi:hypothetical protein